MKVRGDARPQALDGDGLRQAVAVSGVRNPGLAGGAREQEPPATPERLGNRELDTVWVDIQPETDYRAVVCLSEAMRKSQR